MSNIFHRRSDADFLSICQTNPYLGKDENRNASTPLGEFFVIKLLEPYTMKGKTVTTNYFFYKYSFGAKIMIFVAWNNTRKQEGTAENFQTEKRPHGTFLNVVVPIQWIHNTYCL